MTSFEGKHFVFLVGHISQLGGAERQALLLARLIRDRVGARVSFLAWSVMPGLMTDALAAEGIDVHSYPLAWGDRTPGRNSRLAKMRRLAGFARYTRRHVKPDYLLPYVSENSKVAGLIWRASGARYSWWNQRDEGREIYGSRLERWLLRTLPDVVSNSWEGRKFLVERLGVPEARVRIINNAVIIPEATDGAEWRARLSLSSEDRLALMVANLTKYKDHTTLLDAFAIARKKESGGRRFHLALAGRPDEMAQMLKARAFELGLGGRVHFLGAVADIDPLYDAADLVVHSSMFEGCPNAVLEGMAHGKCVAGTDISGLRQALGDHSDEYLSPARDAKALADVMVRFLSDDAARAEAGERNKGRIASEFSPGRLLDSVLSGIAEKARPA